MTIQPRERKNRNFRFPSSGDRLTPADRLIAQQHGTYFKLSEAAEIVGRSGNTLRRLMRSKRVKAPSFQIIQGGMLVYLFTPEDIEEIKQYYSKQKPEARTYEETEND